MDYGETLLASLSPAHDVRSAATAALQESASADLGTHLVSLARVLAGSGSRVFAAGGARAGEARVAAGIAVKNALSARDAAREADMSAAYLQLPAPVRSALHGALMDALARPGPAGTAVAQALAAVGRVETEADGWPDLVPSLLSASSHASPAEVRRCALEAIGFLCERTDPERLSRRSGEILTALVGGLADRSAPAPLRIAAATALSNALHFVRGNMAVPAERDVLMRVVCEASVPSAGDASVATAATAVLCRIAQLYYSAIGIYMAGGLGAHMAAAVRSDDDSLALQAIEFWASLCEAELRADEPLAIVRGSASLVMPALLSHLRAPDADLGAPDAAEDEWDMHKAAATCLSLLSEALRDDVLADGTAVAFVEAHVSAADAAARDAGLHALGAILIGPSGDAIAASGIASRGPPLLLAILAGDPSPGVRDSAAWVLGQLVDYHADVVADAASAIHAALVQSLGDVPRVARNACWALMSVWAHYGAESLPPAAFGDAASALIAAAARLPVLGAPAYDALASIVAGGAPPADVSALQANALSQLVAAMGSRSAGELAGRLCALLAATVRVVGADGHVPHLAHCVLAVMQAGGMPPGVAEDALGLASALLSVCSPSDAASVFSLIIQTTTALLAEGGDVGRAAAGVLGDAARALAQNDSFVGFADATFRALLLALESLMRASSKYGGLAPAEYLGAAAIVSALGDTCAALGPRFASSEFAHPTLAHVLDAASHASLSKISALGDDWDAADALIALTEAALLALTSIVQASAGSPGELALLDLPLEHILMWAVFSVAASEHRTEPVVRAVAGLLGDLAQSPAVGAKVRSMLAPNLRPDSDKSPALAQFFAAPLPNADAPLEDATRAVIAWAHASLSQQP